MNSTDRMASTLIDFLAAQTYDYVIKVYVPRPGQEPGNAWKRVEKEVAVLADMNHPSIIKVEDWGELEDGRRFIVMPRYRKGSVVKHRDRFSGRPLEGLRAVIDILSAMEALHDAGAAHRDIKPDNLLVGDDGRLVLSDFGLVMDGQHSEVLTQPLERIGNWQYMPDWVYTDERHTRNPLADLYGVGKVLWWLASGREPLPREKWDHPVHDLTILYPKVPGMVNVNAVLLRVLKADPEDIRYRNATHMKADVISQVRELETGRHSPAAPMPRFCLACHEGIYARVNGVLWSDLERWMTDVNRNAANPKDFVAGVEAYRCNACGHMTWYARHPRLE
jgi:serine/threonine protein kinase